MRNAILQPGMCSASVSESRTWIGPPGEFATHLAIELVVRTRGWDRRLLRTSAGEGQCEIAKPARVRPCIVVEVGDDFLRLPIEPGVSSTRQAVVLGSNDTHAELFGDLCRRVFRSVVNDDDFVVWVIERRVPRRQLRIVRIAVVRAHDDRDAWPDVTLSERDVREGTTHRGQRGLRAAITSRQSEGPVLHVASASMPLVGPGEDESTGDTGLEGRVKLRVEHFGLYGVPVSPAVEAQLADEQRCVADEVVKPGRYDSKVSGVSR